MYLQLYAQIREKIQSGEYGSGALIPAESEYMKRYEVSRITIRKAFDQLVQEGWIERKQGRGTFVKSGDPEQRSCMHSFTDQMLSANQNPTTTLMKLEIKLAGAFGRTLPFGDPQMIVLIERLRKLNDKPAGLVRSYIPYKQVPGISAKHFATEGREQSLLFVLERHFGVLLDKGEETIHPICIEGEDADSLEMQEGAAALLKTCFIKNVQGEAVLFEDAYWIIPQINRIQRRPSSLNDD